MKKQLLTIMSAAGLMWPAFDASAHENTYKVQSGDSLWKIAQSNNVTAIQLMEWNRLSTDRIYVGQVLSLLAPHSHDNITTKYTVKSGDTLWGIAKTFNLSVTELKNQNNLTSDTIRVGQILLVRGSQVVASETVSSGTTSSTYTVISGDTLWVIATRHNLSVSQLKTINNLNSDIIYVGQVLKVESNSTNSVPTTTTGETSVTTTKVEALITEAKKYIGVPYVWGGSTPSGFDCSGFLNYVYNNVGISIPRTVATIWDATKAVSTPKAGDLVFFETYAPGPSHAGIYIGNNKFIHAGSSTGVTISDMTNTYWMPRYLGSKTTF